MGYSVPASLPLYYQQRLEGVALVELLWLFLEYLTGGRVDVTRDCLTLRGQVASYLTD